MKGRKRIPSLTLYVLCVGFPTGRDSATFSWDKGTTGQVQNLATGRAGTAYQNQGRDTGHGTGQSLFFSYDFLF